MYFYLNNTLIFLLLFIVYDEEENNDCQTLSPKHGVPMYSFTI